MSQLDSDFLEIRLTTLDIIDEIYRELWDNVNFRLELKKLAFRQYPSFPPYS